PKRAREIVDRLAALPDWSARSRFLREYPRLQPPLGVLGDLLGRLTEDSLRPADALEMVWNYYQLLLPRLYEDTERRVRDIEELLRVSQGYAALDDFLADLLLEVSESREEAEKDRLHLSTVHSAKGLEWRVVFVIWLTEGRFPSTHARESYEELEEERRLLYVAITRAREKLFLTYPLQVSERGGHWQRYERCRFLTGLPEDLLARSGGAPANLSRPSPLGKPAQDFRPERPVKESPADEGFPVGLKVFHSLFGAGVVEEAPRDRKVRVRFRQYGSKVLHLDFAKLEKV
ncbi:MAG: ATP-binding domain-containing protein, partial [Deltaproteobacteria bacterium]|nr:ATP-binding domain-containing protein [Deltaproteobacteria bacterium]